MSAILQRISKSVRVYKDFDIRMGMNPITTDVNHVIDEYAVMAAVRNIAMISTGEKLFNPDFGGDVQALLFENWDPRDAHAFAGRLRSEILANEPRAKEVDVVLTDRSDENAIEIKIVFTVANISEPLTVTQLLYRTR